MNATQIFTANSVDLIRLYSTKNQATFLTELAISPGDLIYDFYKNVPSNDKQAYKKVISVSTRKSKFFKNQKVEPATILEVVFETPYIQKP